MFSSGNTTERQRMGRLDCAGETVVDLYAGIGYYTLPFLCKAGKHAKTAVDLLGSSIVRTAIPPQNRQGVEDQLQHCAGFL